MRVSRVFAVVVMAAAAVLLAGSVPGVDGVWRGGDESGALQDQSGLDEPAPLDGSSGEQPAVVECDWEQPPRPDSALDIPDPDDYLQGGVLADEIVEFNGHRLPIAELVDLMWIADDMGISVEEAIFRYGWQTQFSEVATRLESTYPDQFAGAAIVDNGCRARIAFRGPVPDLAVELAATLPVRVELVGDTGFSQAELVDTLQEVYGPIVTHPEIANASGGPDPETGIIQIHAQPRGPTTPTERAALCARLQPPPPDNPSITVQLTLVEDLDAGPRTRTHVC
jgi:hypothetical protein